MVLRIHPGIGVARVGNSPEWFVGPETVDIPATPAGGYRDDEGRIRRQAARYRVFDDITPVAGTSVSWSVTFGTALSNGTATISGANQVVSVLVGATVVAELRTDADGNLLVLSCEINSTATNGCGDGPVQATVGATAAVSSWVVAVPPDFAPGILPRLPCSFLFLDWICAHGLLSPPAAATPISFRRVIYPAIRGRTSQSPAYLLGLATEAERMAEVPFYTPAAGEPAGIEGAYLHAVVEHFHSGTFIDDWATPTPLDPDSLDLAPLTFVDGACPLGWELRFEVPSAVLPLDSTQLRFGAAAVSPGVLAPFFGWAADVPACWGEWVTVTGAPYAIGDWSTRGFWVEGGSGLVYQDTHTLVTLVTTVLDFGPVQRGSAVARRIEFGFEDYFGTPLPFQFVTLPPPLEVLAMSGTVGDPPAALTVIFKAGMGDPLGSVSVPPIEVHVEGQAFVVPVTAEIIEAETTQLALVLDCSLSMDGDRGDGLSKLLGLKAAVDVVIAVARENDGIAVAPFSDDPLPGFVAQSLGDPTATDPRRVAVHDFVAALHTVGNTSIGDGIVSARSLLTETLDPFLHDALVVITDGVETAPAWLRDVGSSIGEDTFAIGIGTSADVNEDHLREITAGHHGYLLLTGDPVSTPNQYLLEKYLLQILAGATNDQVIRDPLGSVVPGVVSRVPFPVSDAEFRVEVVVVADQARELALALMGPDGTVHTFEDLAGEPGVEIVRRGRVGLARVPVPLVFGAGQRWDPGTWTLLLAERSSLGQQVAAAALRQAALSNRADVTVRGKPISYAAVVNARSSLALQAHIAPPALQSSRLTFEASVTYAGVPLRSTPLVSADVRTPLGSALHVKLDAVGEGRFVGELATTVRGDYSARLRARGFSPRGYRFARELTYTPSLGVPPSQDRSRCEHHCDCHARPSRTAKLKGLFECLIAECRRRRPGARH